LAELYEVETRVLIQAVKRNMERFPQDFMFQLTKEELENWKSQIVISNSIKMGLRKLPYAFTELGVSMLSSILNSSKAIRINIQIMRAISKSFSSLDGYDYVFLDLGPSLSLINENALYFCDEVFIPALIKICNTMLFQQIPYNMSWLA
jgi:hypothetical protein